MLVGAGGGALSQTQMYPTVTPSRFGNPGVLPPPSLPPGEIVCAKSVNFVRLTCTVLHTVYHCQRLTKYREYQVTGFGGGFKPLVEGL